MSLDKVIKKWGFEVNSVYDIKSMSLPHLVYELLQAIKEFDKRIDGMDTLVQEKIDLVNELIQKFLSDDGVRQAINEVVSRLQEQGELSIGIDDINSSKFTTYSSEKITQLIEGLNGDFTRLIDELRDYIKETHTSINVKEFGAVLDGVVDDTTAIKKAHEFANDIGLPVFYPKGKLLINDTITVKTDVDMSQVEVVVTNNHIDKLLFKVESDNTFTSLNPSRSGWSKGQEVLTALSEYANHVLHIKSDENLCLRDGSTPYKKEETNALLRDGELMFGGLLCDYTGGTVNVEVRPIDTGITIKLPIFHYGVNQVNKHCQLMVCYRDNTRFIGGQVVIPSRVNVQNTTWVGTLFENIFCINQYYDGLIASNITGNVASGNSAYVLMPTYMAGLYLDRLQLTSDTWGSIGCNSCKEIHVRDSKINRLDCHVLQTNMYVRDCEINGKQQINIGCGRGVVMIDGCYFHHPQATAMVNHRGDYGGMFEGDIFITNCKYQSNSSSQSFCFTLNNANGNINNVSYKYYCPNLHITNLKVDTPSQFVVYGLPQVTNGATFQLPFEVNVDNVTQRYENDERYISVFYVARNHSAFYTDSGSKCHVTINRVNRQSLDTINLSTTDKENVRDSYYRRRPLYYFENYDASPTNYQNRMIVSIANSTGSVYIENHNVELRIENSHIWGFKNCYGGSKKPKRTVLIGSTIFPVIYSGLTGSPFDCTNLQMMGCVLRPVSVEGTSLPISLENTSSCIVLSGNVANNLNSSSYANDIFNTIGSAYTQK